MYKLKTNRFKVDFVTSRCMMVFKKYQAIAYPGDVVVHFGDSAYLFSGDDFKKFAEEIAVEKSSARRGKKK